MIIIVMRNIVVTTSPDSTTITPEALGATTDTITHDFPTVGS